MTKENEEQGSTRFQVTSPFIIKRASKKDRLKQDRTEQEPVRKEKEENKKEQSIQRYMIAPLDTFCSSYLRFFVYLLSYFSWRSFPPVVQAHK